MEYKYKNFFCTIGFHSGAELITTIKVSNYVTREYYTCKKCGHRWINETNTYNGAMV